MIMVSVPTVSTIFPEVIWIARYLLATPDTCAHRQG